MLDTDYVRVIPRDLFNEANLLKCLGRVYINLESADCPDVSLEHDSAPFAVAQDSDSGALCVENVTLKVRGKPYRLFRPLNSRRSWPLWLYPNDDTEIEVFTDDGAFSEEMKAFLAGDQS